MAEFLGSMDLNNLEEHYIMSDLEDEKKADKTKLPKRKPKQQSPEQLVSDNSIKAAQSPTKINDQPDLSPTSSPAKPRSQRKRKPNFNYA